jgi:hypothetical protein
VYWQIIAELAAADYKGSSDVKYETGRRCEGSRQ